jgi:hypothetical protein
VKPSILLIDDRKDLLSQLIGALRAQLTDEDVDIRDWTPTNEDKDAYGSFKSRVDENTVLVVTDLDLTGQGQLGLFGTTIVAWCQTEHIPVADFSRGKVGSLPKEPNLFELRVPSDPETAAPAIAALYRGFEGIRRSLRAKPQIIENRRSPAAVLSEVLGVPSSESQFALYGLRLGTANASLMEEMAGAAPDDRPTTAEKGALLGYIIGHLLLNAVLRFPGPILSTPALMAYVACGEPETAPVSEIFANAKYSGPFSELEPYFWLTKVDETLEQLSKKVAPDSSSETTGGFNRTVLESVLGRTLKRHECDRCKGENGGFYCPFTRRTVCVRPDCSVGSNSWIPQGAKICRIERDFYEEWSPILGL